MKRSKKWRNANGKIDRLAEYSSIDAFTLLKETASMDFDETVDIAINLGVDPRKGDQVVRSAVVLPNGLGKDVKVLVFAQGEKVKEAEAAGADFVGGDDIAQKIQGGWLGFDAVVATPDMMRVVGKLGKILGTRGLMPNPKVGTVTMNVESAVKELKAGKVEFRTEKGAILHAAIGKISFEADALVANAKAFIDQVNKVRPTASKGTYIKRITVSTTMGQGIKLDVEEFKK